MTRVHINEATKDQLMAVPEMNQELAQRILENRPFTDAKDLDCLFSEDDPRLADLRERFAFPEGGEGG